MGIVFGLAAALCWGLGDFLITHLTRRVGTTRALVSIQVLSLLTWLLLLLLFRPAVPIGGIRLWGFVLCTGICHVLGLALVYRAFEVGTLSLVSPMSSSFAIVTAVLALVAGERPPALALGGALLLCLGVMVATRSARESGTRVTLRGVPEALGSALAFGTMFWMFYFFVQPATGYLWPLIILKTMASSSSLVAHRCSGRNRETAASVPGPWGPLVLLAAGAALADTLAWLAYIQGTATAYATIVTAVASLFSVITILLAWALLRERLARSQWVGVGVILVGILLVSI